MTADSFLLIDFHRIEETFLEKRQNLCYDNTQGIFAAFRQLTAQNIHRTDAKMNNLRKLGGISILLTLSFMVIALFQYQAGESVPLLPDQLEYYFNESWTIFTLSGQEAPTKETIGGIHAMADDASAKGNALTTDLPYEGQCGANDLILYQNTLPADFAGLTLNFTSYNANVCVALEERVVYQHTLKKDEKKNSNSSIENYIDIPKEFQGGELWIALSSPIPNAAASLKNVKIETRDMMIIGVVENNIADIGCCLLIVITAILMFVLATIRRFTQQPSRGEQYLGLTGLAAGLYCFIGTDTLSVFYNIQEAYEMQEYLALLIPLFLTMYFDRNFHAIYPRRFSALLWCVIANAVGQILLHVLGIQSLERMMNLSAAAVGAVCVTSIATLIQFDYKNKRYQTLPTVLSMLTLLAGGFANIIMNKALHHPNGNAAGQYSMAIFSILMAAMHMLQISKEYRASAEDAACLLKEKVKAAKLQNAQLALAKKDADAARHEALAANEAKGKFLAHMSHEIRTPINAVLGMDEMILRESTEQNIKDYAMDIHMAGQTLLSLINDILDFSKIESGKMEIVPVEYDISSLIHDLTNMALQRAKAKQLALEVEVDQNIPSRLFGDDVRIRQILTNLLTNAVKYTHEGTVWLRIRGRSADNAVKLYFEVEDTGIGIKEEDLPKLSSEFERIEEEKNRNIEGTGLGLNITMKLLSLLGGKLTVESAYGKGSKFSFELEQEIVDQTPIGDFELRVRQIAENYSYSAKFCAPDAKILVVDDNAVNRKVLRNLLKKTQIQVTDADSGMKCLELIQETHFDLIFLDHMMPEMDGVETLRRIKQLSDFPCQGSPIVALTANAVSGARERYLSEGFDDFLSKPVVPEKLEQMIKKLLPDELLCETENEPGAAAPPTGADSAEAVLESLPQVDGLDWQYAWLHLPETELLEFTVKEFYAQIDPAADRLEQMYAQLSDPAQLEQYRIQVHAMKSLAATIGILPLSGVAKLLEFAAKDGKIETILSLTGPFLEEWRSYRQKLQGVFGISDAAKKETADPSLIKALLEMTRISMQEMDIDQADQSVRQLREYSYSKEADALIQKLADAVTNLDAEETDRIANLLIKQLEQ